MFEFRFTSIPSCLYSTRNLEILIAVNNKIEKIDLDGLRNLPFISVLDLHNNNIAQVPPELGLLPLKCVLCLNHNISNSSVWQSIINTLTISFSPRSLNLEGNAFRVPSYHILSQGTDAVLRFLQNRIPK